MNRVFDVLVGLVLWPLICFWQAFDRLMVNVMLKVAAFATLLILLAAWGHFASRSAAPSVQAAPAIIAVPSPPAALTGPYWLHNR